MIGKEETIWFYVLILCGIYIIINGIKAIIKRQAKYSYGRFFILSDISEGSKAVAMGIFLVVLGIFIIVASLLKLDPA